MDFKTLNPHVIEQFRSGREIDGVPGVSRENHILLTTVGRKSGRAQTIPLRVFHAQDDRLVVVAGNGGRAPNPGWYLNLLAEPRVTIEDTDALRAAYSSGSAITHRVNVRRFARQKHAVAQLDPAGQYWRGQALRIDQFPGGGQIAGELGQELADRGQLLGGGGRLGAVLPGE